MQSEKSLSPLNPGFKFKQFSICTTGICFPVTTDSVLLGAWAEVGASAQILDIGTGSGLLAIMLAQRSDQSSVIDAVETDPLAVKVAEANVKNSTWTARIKVQHSLIQNFVPNKRYDVIICNPPYFNEKVYSPSVSKNKQRNQTSLDFNELSLVCDLFLKQKGSIFVVVPFNKEPQLSANFLSKSIYCVKMTKVYHNKHSEPSVALLKYGRSLASIELNHLILYDEQGKRSLDYHHLVKDFYL
ncbi:MAG: methyltransferase [Saprospiraceae bacterium]|nr:methyltransferase [Saprospiraceae bacterium]MBK7797349.1 methyltransferase [Saprospiraceae bacterium]MBK9377841.1 methyltransferase [Saprospiraceae bacterium]MBL0261558.1 methyltransferase [Saprospiraceae bacterium]